MRRRAVLLMPSGFTIANLFFGVWAIVSAARDDFSKAGLYVVLGGVCDILDGRVARATRTGSRFGEELDSLVDIITFAVAPALIMYFAVLEHEGRDWLWAFGFIACAAIRLARFNVEQAGRKKTVFHGLPSPAAGATLATYYWFSQTALYSQTFLAELPWQQTMRYLMLGLGMLMISNVEYPVFPTVGLRTIRGILGTLVVVGTLVGIIWFPKEYFFPFLVAYVAYGVVTTAAKGLMERLPGAAGNGPDDDEDELDEDQMDVEDVRGAPLPPGSRPRFALGGRRRPGGDRFEPPDSLPEDKPE
jgi:CDP-diacylglycerol--serine O-phosphatidyltransferase